MELTDLSKALVEQNSKGDGYQIHLNSENLVQEISERNNDIEFGDLYFTECKVIGSTALLSFGNMGRMPVDKKEDGTNLYPPEINSNLFVDMSRVEVIEEVKDYQDWFSFHSTKVINIYMFPQNNNMDGNRNVLTIGFM